MAIRAVVCTYRGGEFLQGALASSSNQTLDRERYAIIVVDDAPKPEIRRRQMAALYSHTITLLTGLHRTNEQ